MASAKKRVRKKKREVPDQFRVRAEYAGMPDRETDREIKRLARGHFLGSGYAFAEEWRDVEYGYFRRQSAIAAAQRLRARFPKKATFRVCAEGRLWP